MFFGFGEPNLGVVGNSADVTDKYIKQQWLPLLIRTIDKTKKKEKWTRLCNTSHGPGL